MHTENTGTIENPETRVYYSMFRVYHHSMHRVYQYSMLPCVFTAPIYVVCSMITHNMKMMIAFI